MIEARPIRTLWRAFALVLVVLAAFIAAGARAQENNIAAELVADGPAVPGEEWTIAIRFMPKSDEWHGYWENPGDAGYGMQLDWQLPQGWEAGKPRYPVPQRLLISGLMNHVYEGRYAVLVPIRVPEGAVVANLAPISVDAQWLACTDEICVPEEARLTLPVTMAATRQSDARFDGWRAAIPPMLDSEGTFEVARERLRIGIPLPAALDIGVPHVFVAARELGDGFQPAYAAGQTFIREGDLLVAEIPLTQIVLPPDTEFEFVPRPDSLSGIITLGEDDGVRFVAQAGDVPLEGAAPLRSTSPPSLWTLAIGALLGGLALNILPCVFPILSLKALSLARAGGDEAMARREGIAYAAGAVLACVALGGALLLLRSAGENIGWAFQLQEPAVVVLLLVLAVAITANLAGLFALPSLSITRSGEPTSAFATGLLAAFVATPCTGPFMAAALGAALILPPVQALVLFGMLGLGLALPFLAIGFIPVLRGLLPQPGAWMERFRKAMAIPMGLTALALVWLVARLGGQGFALMAMVVTGGLLIALTVAGRLQQRGKPAWPASALIAAPFLVFAGFALPASYSDRVAVTVESLLDPARFSETALAEARASGRPVFVWFTADWCVTCKVNERVAIEREETRMAFEEAGVVVLRGDWTRRDEAITGFLTRQGAAGVPLYLWYEPGGAAEQLPQILTSDALVTLARRSRDTGQ